MKKIESGFDVKGFDVKPVITFIPETFVLHFHLSPLIHIPLILNIFHDIHFLLAIQQF